MKESSLCGCSFFLWRSFLRQDDEQQQIPSGVTSKRCKCESSG